MNELEKQLSLILEKAIEVAEKSGEFAIEQAPLLLQEFYMWHIVSSCINVVCVIAIIIIVHKVCKSALGLKENPEPETPKQYIFRSNKYWYSNYSDGDSDSYTVYRIVSSLSWLTLAWAIVSIYRIVFILVAPKLYLIEYFIK